MKAVLSSLERSSHSAPISVFDVGANIGDWSAELLLANPNVSIHAFEPSSSAFSCLSKRFADDPRVILHNFALGDFNGMGKLYFDSPSSGFASLTNRRLDHFDLKMSASESIQVKTLDTFKQENLVSCDILKVDIEGNELKALQSGLEILKECKVVLFEFGGANLDSRTNFQDFWYFFKALNFRLSRVTPSGLREVKHYSELDEIYVTTNFLALRQ